MADYLITRSAWHGIPGTPADWDHPRYAGRVLGKGSVAVAKSKDAADPYMMANDAVVLVSHRFDLLRLWNTGSVSAYLSEAPDGKRAVVQMVFYAREMNGAMAAHGPVNVSVRVAGRYRTARLLTFDKQPLALGQPDDHGIGMVIDEDSVELHLPPLSCYAGCRVRCMMQRTKDLSVYAGGHVNTHSRREVMKTMGIRGDRCWCLREGAVVAGFSRTNRSCCDWHVQDLQLG